MKNVMGIIYTGENDSRLRELTMLLRRSSANLNQLTKHVHETARIYDADLESLRAEYDKLLDAASVILSKLAAIR